MDIGAFYRQIVQLYKSFTLNFIIKFKCESLYIVMWIFHTLIFKSNILSLTSLIFLKWVYTKLLIGIILKLCYVKGINKYLKFYKKASGVRYYSPYYYVDSFHNT